MTRTTLRFAAAAIALSAGGLLGTGCGSGEVTTTSDETSDESSNDISGSVKEWEVKVSSKKASAGDVTFTIKNDGTIMHEFLVVKTDIADGEIPLDGEIFSEESEGITVVDEIPEYDAGTTESLTLTLTPGKYQLVCNIEGHYKAGMHTAFTVN